MRFTVDSRASDDDPTAAKGTIHVNHKLPDGKPFADFVAKVDCLVVGGKVAVVTAVITRADLPGLPGVDLVGKRVGLTVHDDGRSDRVGWSWGVAGFDQDVPQCLSTAPFFKTTRGDFRVR